MKGFSDANEFKAGVLINKSRFAQGWTALQVVDLKPIAAEWRYQLDRHGVPHQYYQDILDRAIDRRIMHLAKGENVPMLSVELLLAMFRELKTELSQKCQEIVSAFKRHSGLAEQMAYALDNQKPLLMETVNTRYEQSFQDYEQSVRFVEHEASKKDYAIRTFWEANYLPDEAQEWLN